MFNLKDDNLYQYAFNGLKSRQISESEFRLLLKHIVYIKRLLKKYKDNFANINANLLLNHFIILYNELDIKIASHILFFSIADVYYPQIKSILIFLNKIKEEEMYLMNNNLLLISEIQTDKTLLKILNQITSK